MQFCLKTPPVVGKTKIDTTTLIQQGMLFVALNYYSVLIYKRFIIALPNPERVSTTDCANWLYTSVDPEMEEERILLQVNSLQVNRIQMKR